MERIIVIDDIDESHDAKKTFFSLNDKSYEIDLGISNLSELERLLAPYIAHAREFKPPKRKSPAKNNGPAPAEIRAWAVTQGIDLGEKGRVSAAVRAAYLAGHPA